MVVYVLFDLGLGGKTSSAVRHGTAEGSVALVCPRVLIQDRFLSEILAALSTFVRLLTGMNPKMLVEYCALSKVTSAIDATVGLFVCVDPQVLR